MALQRTIRWRSLSGVGLEHAFIADKGEFIQIRSILIGEHEGAEFGVIYEIALDAGWTFRSLVARRVDGVNYTLLSDGRGRWEDGHGKSLPALDGCIDLDISGTPFTNSLPIRRARWEDASQQTLAMAWLPLSTFKPFRDEQIYTRLGDGRWHYEAKDGGFTAELTVDSDGLVISYPPLFERV